MAIDKTRLAVEPTFNNNLGTSGSVYLNPRGLTQEEYRQGEPNPPEEEGQLRLERTDRTDLCRIYVSVEVEEGVFEWKLVQPISVIRDTTTGRAWDPAANYIYSYAR